MGSITKINSGFRRPVSLLNPFDWLLSYSHFKNWQLKYERYERNGPKTHHFLIYAPPTRHTHTHLHTLLPYMWTLLIIHSCSCRTGGNLPCHPSALPFYVRTGWSVQKVQSALIQFLRVRNDRKQFLWKINHNVIRETNETLQGVVSRPQITWTIMDFHALRPISVCILMRFLQSLKPFNEFEGILIYKEQARQ